MLDKNTLAAAGTVLFASGLIIAAVGAVLYLLGRWGIQWPHIPGDLTLRAGNTTVHLPIATSIILSIVLTLIFYVVGMLRR